MTKNTKGTQLAEQDGTEDSVRRARRGFLGLTLVSGVLSAAPALAQFRTPPPNDSGKVTPEKATSVSGMSGKITSPRKSPEKTATDDDALEGTAESESSSKPANHDGQVGKGPKYGPLRAAQRWRFGVTMKAKSTPVQAMRGYIPVPKGWTEQVVSGEQEDVSSDIRLTYQEISGVRVMVVQFVPLRSGQEAKAMLTCEVKTQPILPPEDPEVYRIPVKIPAELRIWTRVTPQITMPPKVKTITKEAGYVKTGTTWDELRKIYDFLVKEYPFEKGCGLEDTASVLRGKKGNAFGVHGLFVAACRSLGVPARVVWMLPARCYAEFYLEDGVGNGFWFPADLSVRGQFGRMDTPGIIYQRGDSFQPPWDRSKPVYMLRESIQGSTTGERPECRYTREPAAI